MKTAALKIEKFLLARKIIHDYDNQPQNYWDNLRNKTLYASFLKAATVPAYTKFLKERGLRRFNFKTAASLAGIPFINKKNYFQRCAPSDLFEQHKGLKQALIVTSTSGSTGKPIYFFRSKELDWQYSVLAEYFLGNGPAGSTLLVNCFGMGVWIGGLITYEAFRLAGLNGYPVTVIAPGVNKKEIFHVLRDLAPNFDNLIISGYPPFIKDILDEAENENVDFKKFQTRFLFAAESFTENFRDYVCKKACIKDPVHDTLNIYGSAELGAMAFETPFSIFIRRLALKYPKVYSQLFAYGKLPTLAQYNPGFVAFEEQNGEIFISAPNVLPLVRYQIGDNGGIYTFSQVEACFKSEGVDLKRLAKNSGVRINALPFVYVYERNDFSTTLYGLQIYPQVIKEALEKRPLEKLVTGKFVMATRYNKKSDQFLEINVELEPKLKATRAIQKKIEKEIMDQLLTKNSEFRELYGMIKEKCYPVTKLWNYNHPTYFKSGIKQRWIKTN